MSGTAPDGRPTIGAHGRTVWDDEMGRARCTANSKQAGRRCRQRPSPGATTCHWHGAKAPQVERAAKLRLLDLVDPAITQLGRILVGAEKDSDKLRAIENIMDRGGFPRSAEVTLQEAKDQFLRRLLERRQGEEGDDGS